MKSLISALLILFLALSLGACTKAEAPSADTDRRPGREVYFQAIQLF